MFGFSQGQSLFGGSFTGDFTWYGDQQPAGQGNCGFQFSQSNALPWTTGITTFAAINQPQWQGSQACGQCFAYKDAGGGLGSSTLPTSYQYLITSDLCPECKINDHDLATTGDGRKVGTSFAVQCNVGLSTFQYSFAGSSAYYVKMSVTNTRVPVQSVDIQLGQDFAAMVRTTDNYFQISSGTPLSFPAVVRVTSVLGDQVIDTVPATSVTGPPVQGSKQFPFHPELDQVVVVSTESVSNKKSPPNATAAVIKSSTMATYSVPPAQTTNSTSNTTCTIPVAPYTFCGGKGSICQNYGVCADAQVPGTCCSTGFTCKRLQQWFWMCDRVPSAGTESSNGLTQILDYSGCGGLTVDNTTAPAGVSARDGPWINTVCSDDFQCVRQDRNFWQCLPLPVVVPSALSPNRTSSSNGSTQIESSGPSDVPISQVTCF